jgi:cytochrome c5
MKKIGWVSQLSLAVICCGMAISSQAGPSRQELIEKRIKPVGEVTLEGAAPVAAVSSGPLAADSGQKRYDATCHTCHATGLLGAPKFGDKAAWASRLADGKETIYTRAIQGYKGMPPKGTCMQCSDAEIRAAVDYMLAKAK